MSNVVIPVSDAITLYITLELFDLSFQLAILHKDGGIFATDLYNC